MAKRFTSEVYSLDGTAYVVDIYDADFTGDALPFDIVYPSLKLTYIPDSKERHAAIIGSELTFTMQVNTGPMNTLVNDLIDAKEGRFRVVLQKESVVEWVGLILADLLSIEDKELPYRFQLKASDGLAYLKDIDYNDAGTPYTGRETISDHVANCLKKIGTYDLFTAAIFKTGISWTDFSMTTGDPWTNTRIDHRAFLSIDRNGEYSYKSCYDVLKEVCTVFAASIKMAQGSFHILQIPEYESPSFTLYGYDEDGGSVSASGSAANALTEWTDVKRLSGGQFQAFPSLRYVQIDYKHFSAGRSIVSPYGLGSTTLLDIVDSESNTSTFAWSFDAEYSTAFDGADPFQNHRHVFGMSIAVGDYYLSRPVIIDDSARKVARYGDAEWVQEVAYYEYLTPLIAQEDTTYRISVDGFSPPIPDDASGSVQADYVRTYDAQFNDLTVDFTATFVFRNTHVEIIPQGIIEGRTNVDVYRADNTDANNSFKYKISTIIGDGPNQNTLGHLQVYNGTVWSASSSWTTQNVTSEPILKALASEILAGQAEARKKILAPYWGDITAIDYIIHNSGNYYFLQGAFDLLQDTVDGEWFLVSTNVSKVSAPDKTGRWEDEPDLTPAPITPIRIPTVEEPVKRPTPTDIAVINQLTPLQTATGYASGDAITSLQVEGVRYDGAVASGDQIIVFDLDTGEAQAFTVTANVASGDTVIEVVGTTAAFDITESSRIMVDPQQAAAKASTGSNQFRQVFTGHSSATLSVTENAGDLPANDAKIDVWMNGQLLTPTADYTISGSDITLTWTPAGDTFIVKFSYP